MAANESSDDSESFGATRLDGSSRRYRILLLCDDWSGHAPTVHDSINAFGTSRHDVRRINPRGAPMPRMLDLNEFDVVVIHWTLVCISDSYLGPNWRKAIQDFRGLKVQFIQDDYRWVFQISDRMRELGIHVLYSLAATEKLQRLWLPEKLPGVELRSYLAGYVPANFRSLSRPSISARRTDVGYRGRIVPYWLGRLAQDKLRIGPEFLEAAKPYQLKCDIAWREEDRIYGNRWFDFLSSCRAVLGVESGASIVDYEGTLQPIVDEYVREHPDATFDEVFEKLLAPYEGNLVLNVISPRMFEAIAAGTALVLFRGEYSGILTPERHYIPLEKDYSNLSQVVAKLRDDIYLQELTARAYEEIIASNRYSFQSLTDDFDQVVDRLAPKHPVAVQWTNPFRKAKRRHLVGYFMACHEHRITAPVGRATARIQRAAMSLAHRIRHFYSTRVKQARAQCIHRTKAVVVRRWRASCMALSLIQKVAARSSRLAPLETWVIRQKYRIVNARFSQPMESGDRTPTNKPSVEPLSTCVEQKTLSAGPIQGESRAVWQHATLVQEIHDVCIAKGGYPDAWKSHQACPCCGSPQIAKAFTKYQLSHWSCATCQFTFVNPYPPNELLAQLYNGSYYTAVRELIEYPRARSGDPESSLSVAMKYLEPLIDEVRQHRTSGKWLDVGGGIGGFCALIQQRMPGFEVFLNEASQRSCELAREMFGISIVASDLREVCQSGQLFDVVSAVAVLEHVTHPKLFLGQMLAVLKPGGLLVLHLPRFSPLNRLVSQGSSPVVVPPFHVSLFDEHNLAILLKSQSDLMSARIWTDGPPAFEFKHFLQYGDSWDLRVPTREHEVIENMHVKPFTAAEQEFLSYLAIGDASFAEHLIRVDGCVYLNAVVPKTPIGTRVDGAFLSLKPAIADLLQGAAASS